MFKFITHRSIWINILAALILAGLLLIIFIFSLQWFTHHGESKTVPSVVGKKYADAKKLLVAGGFDVVIQDSVFTDSVAAGTILKQIPESDQVVKINRTVYLVVNRVVPPSVEMPNLVGFSYRNAEMTLINAGLKVGDTTFKPDFAKYAVLEQVYNGSQIKAGTKILMGSKIDLVLGTGVGKDEFNVPDLVGWTYSSAKTALEEKGITLAVISVDANVADTMNAFIYKQDPLRKDEEGRPNRIRSGQLLNVWLGKDKPAGDSTSINQIPE